MAHTYSFPLGEFACTVISDGLSGADEARVAGVFPDMPEDEFQHAFRDVYGEGGMASRSMSMLLVESGEHKALIDTGLGQGAAPNGGGLFEGLDEIGVGLDEIDIVVISHAHGDHIGGLTNPEGALNFPKAHCYMDKIEWEWMMGPEGVARGDSDYAKSMHSKLAAIESSLTFVGDADEVFPGLTVHSSPGHTPGHLAFRLASDGEDLLGLVDIIHFQLQFPDLRRSPRFDWDTSLSVPTRERFIGQAADEGLLTLTYHLPFPGVGMWAREAHGVSWTPTTL